MKQKLFLLLITLISLPSLQGAVTEFTYTYQGQTITYTMYLDDSGWCFTKAGKNLKSPATPGNIISGSLTLPAKPRYGEKEYTLIELGKYSFANCTDLVSVTIPESVTLIGGGAFQGCTGLTSVSIPNSVTTIGGYAFSDCTGLTSISLPQSVTSIENGAFSGCSGLTYINLPQSVTSIGEYAFRGCTGLKSLTIPKSVTSIGNLAFYNCTGLTSVSVPNSITSFGRQIFDGCTNLTSVTIPESMTSIPMWLFSGSGLPSYTIPQWVTSIEQGAFYSCTNLKSVTIPESVTSIGEDAFSSTSLTSVIIPGSVTEIRDGAFSGCESLGSIFFKSTSNPVTNPKFTFTKYSNRDLKVYVPGAAITNYANFEEVAKVYATITSLAIDTDQLILNTRNDYVIPLVISPVDNTDPDYTITHSVDGIVSAKIENGKLILRRLREGNVELTITSAQPDVAPVKINVTVTEVQNPTDGEIVHVATPGTLEELIFDLDATKITSLTVTGRLDASDIQYLNSQTGKMAYLEHLDISGITLQPGDKPYASYMIKKAAEITGGTTGYFYISDTYREEFKSITTGLGGSADQLRVYSPYLDGAFAYTKIKSIVLPDYLDKIPQFMFEYSTSIEAVSMKRPLTEIGQYAFYGATNLESLPNLSSLSSVGDLALFGKLELIDFSNTRSLKKIGREAFRSGVTTIDLSSVEEIDEGAFYYCPTLTGTIDLRNLRIVHKQAFYNTSITGVLFSSKLEEIADNAFADTKLKEVTLPEGITTICTRAFAGCQELTNVTFPSSLVTIASDAFAGTPFEINFALINNVLYINDIAYKYIPSPSAYPTSIVIREGTTIIANDFMNVGYEYYPNLENISSIILPSTLRHIGNDAFRSCKGFDNSTFTYSTTLPNLTELILPDKLEHIGSGAFAYCMNMSVDRLPESLKYIGARAFQHTDFTQVILPENLEFIGEGAFADTNISSVKVYSKNLPLVDPDKYGSDYVFDVLNAMKVYIGASVNNVGASLFNTRISDSAKLLKVEFEDRTTPISFGDYCFNGDLSVVNFPTKIAYVGKNVFYNCDKLNFDLSALSETSFIGESAFEGCTGLTGNLILNGDSIKRRAFYNTGLESITVNPGVHFIGDGAFGVGSSLKEFRYYVEDCEIPWSIFNPKAQSIVITPFPFSRSESETGVTVYIGKNVRAIPDKAFNIGAANIIFEGYENSDPSVITSGSFVIGTESFSRASGVGPLPTNTVSIGEEAFALNPDYSNTGLKYVPGTRFTVPASVKEIGLNAFSGYEELYMYPLEAPVPDDNVGYSRGVQRVYVRPEALESYLNVRQHWQTYEVLVMPGYELEAPTSITFPKPEIGMQVGWNLTLTPNILPDHALNKSLTWTSSNPLVATVDQEGEVTSHARGTTTITATSVADPNVSGSCVITVTDPDFIKVQSVKFKGEITLSVGDVAMSGAIINPTNATEGQLMYIADDPDIVKVIPSTGKLYGLKAGTTTLRVLSDDQQTLYASTTVIVAEKTTDPFDITGDGNVDVTDVVNIVDKIIHKTTEVAFHDLNNDGKVDVADIVVLVSHILNGSGNSTASRSATAVDVPVSFDMSTSYTAMQTDIVVAEGSAIEDVAINAAIARSHTLAYNEIEPGRYRVIVYSPANRTMALEAGEPLFTLSVAGSDTVATEATMFVEAEVVPTGIDGITDGAAVESVTYFDLQGRRVSAEARGILIERTVLTDGTVVNRKIRR